MFLNLLENEMGWACLVKLPESARFSTSGGGHVVDLGGVAISDSSPVRSIIASSFSSARGAISGRDRCNKGFLESWFSSGWGRGKKKKKKRVN